MKRTLLLALALTTAATASYAAAAGLGGLTSGGLAAGSTTVASCDTNGVSVAYTTIGGNVTSVTVGGISDPACEGGRLSITLKGAGVGIGSGTVESVPTDADTVDNSVVSSFTGGPAAEQVDAFDVSVVGP